MAFDAERRQTVLINGSFETWTFDGRTWTQHQVTPRPMLQPNAACFDSLRRRVVLVAGNWSTGLETWEWDGSSWVLAAVGGLLSRAAFALAFDAARGVTLLFGGYRGSSSSLADLWSWDGSSWTQIYNGGPPPRRYSAMVYDAARQTVVLFGGEGELGGQNVLFGDTWEWNGSYWFKQFGLPGPQNRFGHSMVYDSHLQRVRLVGGATGQSTFSDLWEWDGATWQQQSPSGPNPGNGPMAYDAARAVMVLVSTATSTPQTFEYLAGPATAASFAPFGAGCIGPTGVPSLDAVAGSLPRIGTTLQLALSNLPASPFNFPFGIIGFDATTWNSQPLPVSLAGIGMPGCEAWIAPMITETLGNANGVANWGIPLPLNQLYLGTDIYLQGAVLAPGWNAASVVVSNAGHARVGSW